MKTKEEIKEWLLKNCIDEYGNLDLSELDFSDFDGDVILCNMKVKKNLLQGAQEVGGYLEQQFQNVKGYLMQDHQKVEEDLFQGWNEVKGKVYQGVDFINSKENKK